MRWDLPEAERPGRVVIPRDKQPRQHELDTARRLARFGVDVEFLPEIDGEGVKSPDVLIDGEIWELKSPQGSSEKSTIDSQLKRGKRQAENLVIDLARCGLDDEVAIAQILRRFFGPLRLRQGLDCRPQRPDHAFNEVIRLPQEGWLVSPPRRKSRAG